ncbi:MAG: nucleotidyltransferase family protein [Gaiellaceae bacterium]
MKAVVLAAGYATRLYPLTRDRPKALLPIAGKPLLEHLLASLEPVRRLEDIVLVTNAKFAEAFQDWARAYPREVRILDDGTNDEASRLGAIGDLALAIRTCRLEDDLLVLAADNLFGERLDGFAEFGLEKDAPALGVYDVGDLDAIRNYNSIELADDDRVVYFEEKPERPRSTLTGIALYFYPRRMLGLVDQYLAEGRNPDQPGRLVEWLYSREPVYAWRVPGRWFDIGTPETLAEADRFFATASE